MGKGGSGNSSTGGPSGTLRKRPPKIPASSSSSPSPTLPSPNSSNYSNNNNNGTELTRQKLQHTSIAAYISYLTRIIIDKCKVSALAKVAALVIVVLLLVGGSIFWYFQPTIWLKNSPEVNELLSGRTIVTLYPAEINMEESLPNFFMGYAIATPENAVARAAVKAVAEQRAVVTNPGRYRQNIMHLAWNHAHFYQQLVTRQPPGTMDYVCSGGDSDGGTEYQRLYEHFFAGGDLTNLQYHDIADDLLLSCLLRSGTADGFVKQNVRVLRSFAQGEKGVAVVRSFDQKRLHSDLLLLPILSRTERQEQRMNSGDVKRKKSSTVLPTEMTKYLTATLHDFLHDTATTTSTKDRLVDYRRQWEEFLYQVVATEGEDAWVLLHAACSRDERRTVEQHNQHPSLWIATTCQGDQNGEEECCSFYKGPTGDDDFVPRGGKINE